MAHLNVHQLLPRRWLARAFYLSVVAMALPVAFLLRFDFQPPAAMLPLLYQALWLAVLVKIPAFHFGHLHRGWWQFVSIGDLLHLFVCNVTASALFAAATELVIGRGFPRSVFLIDLMLCFLATGAGRSISRLRREFSHRAIKRGPVKRVLMYGAGSAGVMLLRDIQTNSQFGYEVIGFLDDDVRKRNAVIAGAPVLGTGRQAAEIVQRLSKLHLDVDSIIVTMPSASGRQMREALANCRGAGVTCQSIPGVHELLAGRTLSTQIRNISITDLLGREPVRLEEDVIRRHLAGRCVMVTGGAGSIGSELCRQVARFGPRKLIIFDQAESELFKIDLELHGKNPAVELIPRVGDIRDGPCVDQVIQGHAVDSIFHAAAYKHVPLMETHVLEAMRNNILGTWNVVRAAERHGVANFLMISSDKAVNPTNVMGATKRAAELIVSSMRQDRTQFVSVRFGNVLGSNGSVVPIFQAQIAAGGPVTVTHPDMRRYFMTIREAVQLVLQASTMGHGTELFLLDMGEPVRIIDMARNMVRLSGLTPDEDIEIRVVGLRPGEKLFEELMTEGENILPTYHEKIKILREPALNHSQVLEWLTELERLLSKRDEPGSVQHLVRLVPEYAIRRPVGSHAPVSENVAQFASPATVP